MDNSIGLIRVISDTCYFITITDKLKDHQRKKYNIFDSITCASSIYTMDLPVVTVSNFMENSIVLKRANSNLFYFIDITNKLKLVINL